MLASLHPSVVVNSNTEIEVPFGADSYYGQGLLAIYNTTNGGTIEGSIKIQITLPFATSIQFTTSCSNNRMARNVDAANDIFNVPHTCNLNVRMYFEDGSNK